jgi:hypothetical protein
MDNKSYQDRDSTLVSSANQLVKPQAPIRLPGYLKKDDSAPKEMFRTTLTLGNANKNSDTDNLEAYYRIQKQNNG